MAFTLEVLRGATTYNISAGNAISLESVDDLGGASVRNQEEQGPFQDGSSHLSERLEPRTMTLRLNVVGASASALDGYRDTLNAMFKPVRGVPIILKLTRDDGEVRQLDCRRTGPLSIPLEPRNRPGNLHRAVVQLRAADPTWYNPTLEEESLQSGSDWWLAYNTISASNVLGHADSPGTAELMSLSGSVASGGAWTIATRTSRPSPDVAAHMYQAGSVKMTRFSVTGFGGAMVAPGAIVSFTSAVGTANYIMSASGSAGTIYIDNVAVTSDSGGAVLALPTTGRWRSTEAGGSVWTAAMPRAAVYNIALSSTQRAALGSALTTGGSVLSTPVVYAGDYDSYPIIAIHGPILNPSVTNTTTGDTLDFSVSGGTIGSDDTWTIDTRYGRKSVLNSAGSSVAQYLSDDSNLATFHFAPDPIATGGTNVITVGGSATGTATVIEMSYYNRYMSF